MQLAAVITAGGRVGGDFARAIGTQVKALAPFGGSTMLERTVAAVREAGIDRVAVVGGSEVRRACGGMVDRMLDESAGGAENLRIALHAWEDRTRLLYLTSDMPFVCADALRAFVRAAPPNALGLALAQWSEFIARFPGAPEFGIVLAGEHVVNGGAFMIPAGAARRIERVAAPFFNARKNVWSMARLAGPALLARFAVGRLGVAQLESRAHRLLGIPAKAVHGAAPELAYDVDVLEEYRYAVQHESA